MCLGGYSFFPHVTPGICSVFHLVVMELNLYDNNGLEGGGGQKKEIYQLDRGQDQTDFDGMCLDGHRIPFSSQYLFCLVPGGSGIQLDDDNNGFVGGDGHVIYLMPMMGNCNAICLL